MHSRIRMNKHHHAPHVVCAHNNHAHMAVYKRDKPVSEYITHAGLIAPMCAYTYKHDDAFLCIHMQA
jgi:hypothetical protein